MQEEASRQMASTDESGKDDGIDIHCDGERLSLDCGPDAFARFRAFVAAELRDFPDLPFDDLTTIEISNTAKAVEKRDSVADYGRGVLAIGGCLLMSIALGVGIMQIVTWIVQWFSK
jgi:hypothetical protein